MWICSTDGYFSIVCGRKGKKHNGPINQDVLIVRARMKQHLENLRNRLEGLPKVKTTPDRDYPYRIVVSRNIGLKIVLTLFESLTYPNFKDAVKNRHGLGPYESFLYDVWSQSLDMSEGMGLYARTRYQQRDLWPDHFDEPEGSDDAYLDFDTIFPEDDE